MKRILPVLAGALCLLAACNETSSTASVDKSTDPRFAGRVAVSLDSLIQRQMVALQLDSLQIQVKDAWGNVLGSNAIDLRLTRSLLVQNIRPGRVFVEASAWQPGTDRYWYGLDSVNILPRQTANANINLAPATGSLWVTIHLDTSLIPLDSLRRDTLWYDTTTQDTAIPPEACRVFDTLANGSVRMDTVNCLPPVLVDTSWQARCWATLGDSSVCIPGWNRSDSLRLDSLRRDSISRIGRGRSIFAP